MKNLIIIIFITSIVFGKILFAQQLNNLKPPEAKDSLEVIISCDKTEFIQGESIDILVKLKNNTNKTIRTGSPKHYLYHYEKDSLITNHAGNAIIDIPPGGTYYYFVDPVGYVSYSPKAYIGDPLYEGNYEYHISQFVGQYEFTSNQVHLKINSVPDSLQQPFQELKFNPSNTHTYKNWEALFEKYKGTFYEREFYDRLLSFPICYDAIWNKTKDNELREKVVRLYKEFILKYCNTGNAYRRFNMVMYNYIDNKALVEDILTSLEKNKPECKLLDVLRNQPEYMNKEIKYLLN